jgi:hypothetical protein
VLIPMHPGLSVSPWLVHSDQAYRPRWLIRRALPEKT